MLVYTANIQLYIQQEQISHLVNEKIDTSFRPECIQQLVSFKLTIIYDYYFFFYKLCTASCTAAQKYSLLPHCLVSVHCTYI